MKVILGIDPGSRVTGYGYLGLKENKLLHLEHGIINVSSLDLFCDRITQIGHELKKLLLSRRPDVVAIEKIFLGKNADSAFKLGHARGVLIYEACSQKIEICEYATRVVKKGVSGRGEATKEEVQLSLSRLLKIQLNANQLDASDALALAYHHGLQMQLKDQWRGLRNPEKNEKKMMNTINKNKGETHLW